MLIASGHFFLLLLLLPLFDAAVVDHGGQVVILHAHFDELGYSEGLRDGLGREESQGMEGEE